MSKFPPRLQIGHTLWDTLLPGDAPEGCERFPSDRPNTTMVDPGLARQDLLDECARLRARVAHLEAAGALPPGEDAMIRAQRLESLGALASRIAHDFNNLLVAIVGNADITLARLAPEDTLRPPLRDISTAARRASDLCRQMLAYAGHTASARGPSDTGPIDVGGCVREMSDLLRVAVARNIRIDYAFGQDVPQIYGTDAEIQQVVLNLVTNASAAIGETRGTIRIATARTEVIRGDDRPDTDGLRPGTYTVLEVSDTGCGVPDEARERIFEPFVTTRPGARGLGLTGVLAIVRGHGGLASVVPREGGGTTIRLVLPALVQTQTSSLVPVEHRLRADGTALVVEDDVGSREVLGAMLENLGFQVRAVATAAEALALCGERDTDYACVLLDATVWHTAGDSFVARLRALRPDVPLVLTSGMDVEAERRAGMPFLRKPFGMDDLRDTLAAAIGTEADASGTMSTHRAG